MRHSSQTNKPKENFSSTFGPVQMMSKFALSQRRMKRRVLQVACASWIVACAIGASANAQSAPEFDFTPSPDDLPRNSEGEPLTRAISCEENPLAALFGKIGTQAWLELATHYSEQAKLQVLVDDRYSVLVCDNPLTRVQQRRGFGISNPFQPQERPTNLTGVQGPSTAILGPNQSRLYPSLLPDQPTGFSRPSLDFNIVEMCKNPRAAAILALPNTPECRRAAEHMEATGLGSQIFGIPSDQDKINALQEDTIDALERGSPTSSGAAIGIAIGVASLAYIAYDEYRRYVETGAQRESNQRQLDDINADLEALYDRRGELNDDLASVQEIAADPNSEGNVIADVVSIGAISDESANRAVDQGAASNQDIEESIRSEATSVDAEISAKEARKEELEAELGCSEDGEGCGTSCVDEVCYQAAIEAVFNPAREAIAQCEAQSALVEPADPETPVFDSILDSRTPRCEVQFIDDPCYSLSPDGCDPNNTAETIENAERRASAYRLASSIHCDADDAICNQTVTAMFQSAAGMKPSGILHDLACGNTISAPTISVPGRQSPLDQYRDSTGLTIDGVRIQSQDSNPHCLEFMGVERCGESKECHLKAQAEVSESYLGITRSINYASFFRLLAENPQCVPFEDELRTFWFSYGAMYIDLRNAESIELNEGSSLNLNRSSSYRILSNNAGFIPSDNSPSGILNYEGIPIVLSVGIGTEDYYKRNFCE
ncbi:hypothetical protein [uncultured Tateyamaria sp.]|uniref:hypothetical protein n=1 Tax=uncultured Tateyamaria sp. TaxID=455651 RepID=UPI0026094F0F|nr:hypothetical protein [uncultured Tateyamaria sp.]